MIPKAAAAAFATMMMSSCAATWVDADGRTHVVGLVALTLDTQHTGQTVRGVVVETVGASYLSARPVSALSVGYSRDELVHIPLDSEWPPGNGISDHAENPE